MPEIGRELFIGEATVKSHLLRVFAKLGVDDRTRAVTLAMEQGIIASPGRGQVPLPAGEEKTPEQHLCCSGA